MLYAPNGNPAPNADMLRRLSQINPALGMTFVDAGEQGGSHWAITWQWPENDPRWLQVQHGIVSRANAFDILCRMPKDSSPDEAYGYIVRTFKANQSKAEIAKMLDRVHLFNKGVAEDRENEALAEAYNYAEVRGHAIVGEFTGNRVVKVGPGSRPAMNKAPTAKRGPGRPKGSKNKSKKG